MGRPFFALIERGYFDIKLYLNYMKLKAPAINAKTYSTSNGKLKFLDLAHINTKVWNQINPTVYVKNERESWT